MSLSKSPELPPGWKTDVPNVRISVNELPGEKEIASADENKILLKNL